MFALAPAAEPLIRSFAPCFTRPTYQRFMVLLVGTIVTCGRRTVHANIDVFTHGAPAALESAHAGLANVT